MDYATWTRNYTTTTIMFNSESREVNSKMFSYFTLMHILFILIDVSACTCICTYICTDRRTTQNIMLLGMSGGKKILYPNSLKNCTQRVEIVQNWFCGAKLLKSVSNFDDHQHWIVSLTVYFRTKKSMKLMNTHSNKSVTQ